MFQLLIEISHHTHHLLYTCGSHNHLLLSCPLLASGLFGTARLPPSTPSAHNSVALDAFQVHDVCVLLLGITPLLCSALLLSASESCRQSSVWQRPGAALVMSVNICLDITCCRNPLWSTVSGVPKLSCQQKPLRGKIFIVSII